LPSSATLLYLSKAVLASATRANTTWAVPMERPLQVGRRGWVVPVGGAMRKEGEGGEAGTGGQEGGRRTRRDKGSAVPTGGALPSTTAGRAYIRPT
jgi:hypothetical protein